MLTQMEESIHVREGEVCHVFASLCLLKGQLLIASHGLSLVCLLIKGLLSHFISDCSEAV